MGKTVVVKFNDGRPNDSLKNITSVTVTDKTIRFGNGAANFNMKSTEFDNVESITIKFPKKEVK